MRNGFLALLVVLGVSTGVLLAQSSPSPLYSPNGASGGYRTVVLHADTVSITNVPAPELASSPCQFTESDACCSDRFWFRADYLMWWTKGSPIPVPLLTTGSVTDRAPAAIGQPNTQVLIGNESVDYGRTNGMRFDAGLWLDGERRLGIEGGYFLLEKRSSNFSVASDAGGNPILGQPLIFATNPQEFVEGIAIPTLIAGGATVTTQSRLQGWELNSVANAFRGENLNLDLLAGFRVVNLDETLQSSAVLNQLQDQTLSFQGTFLNGPVRETTLDRFSTQNHFYGPQLGGRVGWNNGRLNVSVLGKVALGVDQQLVRIDGASSLTTPGGATNTVPGGVLALSSNSGRFFRDQVSVLPEVGIQIGYHITEHLEAHVGYTFLYLNNVARPGDQIDRVVEPALIPTDPGFGTATGTRPAFRFANTDYWAHGVNYGMEFHY